MAADFAMEAGLSFSQLLTEDFPVAEKFAWQYKEGEDPVRPEKRPLLSTQMRKLHEWYLEVAKEGRKYLVAQVGKDHFLGKARCILRLKNSFSFSIYTPSTKVSSLAILYK